MTDVEISDKFKGKGVDDALGRVLFEWVDEWGKEIHFLNLVFLNMKVEDGTLLRMGS